MTLTRPDSAEWAAVDALTADHRNLHRAFVRLIARKNPSAAREIQKSQSRIFDQAGTDEDFARVAYGHLLDRLGPIAPVIPQLVVTTIPRSSLWAATAPLGDRWLVAIPGGVVSFYRAFSSIVLQSRDLHQQSIELVESIKQMSRLLGESLEVGLADFSGSKHLPTRSKTILEHLTQFAYEFFLLHESYHAKERHEEPDQRKTTWYQEAYQRHANEFAADKWAFITLLASFSNDMGMVVLSIALLFDALDALDRFDFAPLTRLTHPSPATRKWRLLRLLEEPEAPQFLNPEKLNDARQFSFLYERLAAFIVDRANPTSPLNWLLNRDIGRGPDDFVNTILTLLALCDPNRILRSLAAVRSSSEAWAIEGDGDDKVFVHCVNERIDLLAHELCKEQCLRRYASILSERSRSHDML